MSRPRSIILAVVSAKSDFALQQVIRHTRKPDPQGMRTLGLITKPDILDVGSDSERFYIELLLRTKMSSSAWDGMCSVTGSTRSAKCLQLRDKIEEK